MEPNDPETLQVARHHLGMSRFHLGMSRPHTDEFILSLHDIERSLDPARPKGYFGNDALVRDKLEMIVIELGEIKSPRHGSAAGEVAIPTGHASVLRPGVGDAIESLGRALNALHGVKIALAAV